MMGEKLESVSIAAYRDREFYGGYSKLAISTFVSVKIYGVMKVGKLTLKILTASGTFRSCGEDLQC